MELIVDGRIVRLMAASAEDQESLKQLDRYRSTAFFFQIIGSTKPSADAEGLTELEFAIHEAPATIVF